MRDTTLLRSLLPFPRLSALGVRVDDDAIVARVAVRGTSRCGNCGQKCPRYDRGDGKSRFWRHLDVGWRKCWLDADLWRVSCPDCGVHVGIDDPRVGCVAFTQRFDSALRLNVPRVSKTQSSMVTVPRQPRTSSGGRACDITSNPRTTTDWCGAVPVTRMPWPPDALP